MSRARTLRTWRRCLTTSLLTLLAACAREPSALTLTASVTAADNVEFALTGPADAYAVVVLAPPLHGDEEVRAWAADVHCVEAIPADLRQAGAGAQAQGVIGSDALRGTVDAERLAQLPSPMILQALLSYQVDGQPQARLSNAIVVERSASGITLQPFHVGWAIWRAVPRFVWALALPIAFVLVMHRLRRLPPWGLPALLVAIVALRLAGSTEAPLLPRAQGDELQQLEAHYQSGIAAAVAFVRAPERSSAPLYLQNGPEPGSTVSLMRAHWRRLLPQTQCLTADQPLPARGLLVRLDRDDPPPSGELLLRSKRFLVWGLGGQQ